MEITTLPPLIKKIEKVNQQKTIELARAVLLGDQQAIGQLYHWYRKAVFDKVGQRFASVPYEQKEEAFHDAFLTVVDMIKAQGHLENGEVAGLQLHNAAGMMRVVLRCTLLKGLRGKRDFVDSEEYLFNVAEYDVEPEDQETILELTMKAFRQLGEKCQELISAKLLHGLNFKDIAVEMAEEEGTDLNDEEELKKKENQRRQEQFRCVKQLRKNFYQLTNHT